MPMLRAGFAAATRVSSSPSLYMALYRLGRRAGIDPDAVSGY
jgi:hypothetical protein